MSWKQPICSLCYGKREPGRSPVAISEDLREVERCCLCGQNTKEGIYYRIDPAEVVYPKAEEEEATQDAPPDEGDMDPLREAQRAFANENPPPPTPTHAE